MKIGIDISQLAYPGTGVANYLENFVDSLIETDNKNEYILFFSSLRGKLDSKLLKHKSKKNVKFKYAKLPPKVLDFTWNRLHKYPIEGFVGNVDLFITSDWTEPPTKTARKATIIYDLIVYKYPNETHKSIIETQKRKLSWVKKESDLVFAISDSTKNDIQEILGLPEGKIKVVYPGVNPVK